MAILIKWMDINIRLHTPKSKLAKAIRYMLNRWKELNVFLMNPEIEISNNMVENLIRPVAVGRKNWLFSGPPTGAKRAAVFFTLFGGCQLNGIDPYTCLLDVAMRIGTHSPDKLDELLPRRFYRWKNALKTVAKADTGRTVVSKRTSSEDTNPLFRENFKNICLSPPKPNWKVAFP